MNTILWAALAAIIAVSVEFLFKRGWSWTDNWFLFVPLAIAINICIYKMVTGDSKTSTWLYAIAAFNLCTAVARIGLSQFVLGEPIVRGNLVAAVALLFAVTIGRVWR